MNYFWTVCRACAGEITIQFVERPAGLSGSVRRWSPDRSVNDGRRLEVSRSDVGSDGSFRATCVCGEAIAVDPAGVTRATTERPAL